MLLKLLAASPTTSTILLYWLEAEINSFVLSNFYSGKFPSLFSLEFFFLDLKSLEVPALQCHIVNFSAVSLYYLKCFFFFIYSI